jgi:1-deoxy-D-xylulose 5-phosphate reductoisomerase
VAAFLAGRIRFTDIAAACAETLARLPARPLSSLDDALAADAEARRVTGDWLAPRQLQGTVTA